MRIAARTSLCRPVLSKFATLTHLRGAKPIAGSLALLVDGNELHDARGIRQPSGPPSTDANNLSECTGCARAIACIATKKDLDGAGLIS